MNFRYATQIAFILLPQLLISAEKISYLALGDSIPFGYNPLVAPVESNYKGYPEKITLESSPLKWGVNLACPGETSESFFSATAPDRNCRLFKSQFGLHTPYAGTQMSEALFLLQTQKHHVKAVTLTLGGNDLLLLQEACVENPDPTCILRGLPGTIATLGQNLDTILGRLRTEAGYDGPLVLVTYYSPDYNDPLQTAGVSMANAEIARVARRHGALIADGFGVFLAASLPSGSPCTAGLLIQLPDGTCDMHPSPQGRDVLAAAVLSVLKQDVNGKEEEAGAAGSSSRERAQPRR